MNKPRYVLAFNENVRGSVVFNRICAPVYVSVYFYDFLSLFPHSTFLLHFLTKNPRYNPKVVIINKNKGKKLIILFSLSFFFSSSVKNNNKKIIIIIFNN